MGRGLLKLLAAPLVLILWAGLMPLGAQASAEPSEELKAAEEIEVIAEIEEIEEIEGVGAAEEADEAGEVPEEAPALDGAEKPSTGSGTYTADGQTYSWALNEDGVLTVDG